jgi:hypothetical protein
MKKTNQVLHYAVFVFSFCLIFVACQKKERPVLSNYIKDVNPPGGPLKFYAAFDGTTTDKLMNAVDSVRANFPSDNPFTQVAGITGKGVQGASAKDKAIKYPSANDFSKSTSVTVLTG